MDKLQTKLNNQNRYLDENLKIISNQSRLMKELHVSHLQTQRDHKITHFYFSYET